MDYVRLRTRPVNLQVEVLFVIFQHSLHLWSHISAVLVLKLIISTLLLIKIGQDREQVLFILWMVLLDGRITLDSVQHIDSCSV